MEGNQEKCAQSCGNGDQRPVRTVCVFCGSRPGNRPSFSAAALDLGKQMVERQLDLVYGGGSGGLMGMVSKAVYDGGRHVLGVIPSALLPEEVSGETLGEVKVVRDMHERKAEMGKHSDAFIALPGGYGTIEELLEIITWAQLGIHNKPVGLLNVDGYYNSLLSLFDKGVEEGFIDAVARDILVMADTAGELLTKLTEARQLVVAPAAAEAEDGAEGRKDKDAAVAGLKRKMI